MIGLQTEVLDFKVCFDNKTMDLTHVVVTKNTNGNSKFIFSEKATKFFAICLMVLTFT